MKARGVLITSHDGLYGEALPERGTFFSLQVYERVGISPAEVSERVTEKSVFLSLIGPKRANRRLYGFERDKKFPDLMIYSH